MAAAETTVPAPLFPAFESTTVANFYVKTKAPRSTFRLDFKTTDQQGQMVYDIHAEGQGAFHKYRKARWVITSQLKGNRDLLRPLTTRCVIEDLEGQKTVTNETQYDYRQNKIFVTITDPKIKAPIKMTFPLKGPTADYASLSYFLKPLIAKLPQEKNQTFYLLTIEPAMYKVNIKFVAKEELSLLSGKKSAIKIRLIADFGVLDEVLDSLVPPTFIWFEDKTPFNWLQYQGLESGVHSANILAYPTGTSEKMPPIIIPPAAP